MSFDALAWAWNQKTGSSGRKATLMGVAQFADEDGYCWPGQRMLAEYTEQGERTVREHLVWLESNGYLSRCARKRPDGTNASDAYYLNLEKPPAEFKTKRKKQPADFAASEKPKNNRQNPPTADFADGEKQQNQPAKSAGHEPVIVKPKGLTEPVSTARGSRLPNDWTIKPEWIDWTTQSTARFAEELEAWKGGAWSVQHTLFESEKFRDYWCGVAGKAANKTDWPGTWRNWVRKAGPMKTAKNGGHGAWWASDETALAKAIEVGVGPALQTESRDAWHARIRAAIENGGKPPAPRPMLTATPQMTLPNESEKRGPSEVSRASLSESLAMLRARNAGALAHPSQQP
ncbi:hypothetical protein BN2476_830047 [Paraburkholderia piptadeniae]|uniref:Helix-turn-helix domain-containing protein n=1 Tax=Paraburkholderia piptadeniae TaxID=1701573 RepID=A0A1N7ST37_9BURK|nr:helix-turn-helix domain-containing protein [Paraburkholderia piptadeniae]SIT50476.1 hypothetical protein BN2476_830047 [Paraburkholderia piptadeniae]